MTDYDVIVLGGGAPGEHCAATLAIRATQGHRVISLHETAIGGPVTGHRHHPPGET